MNPVTHEEFMYVSQIAPEEFWYRWAEKPHSWFLQDENFSARFIEDSPIWSKWLPEPPSEHPLWKQPECVIPWIFSWFGYWGCSPRSGEQARKIGALRTCTHEAQKYQFCTHQALFWYYIGLYEPSVILIRNLVEKSTEKCQFFFSKKNILKRARKPGFIKIVNTGPIFA